MRILLFITVIALLSCSTTRKQSSYSRTVDSLVIAEQHKKIRELGNENFALLSKVKELESDFQFTDQVCNDSLLSAIIESVQTDLAISQAAKDSLTARLKKVGSAPPSEITIDPFGNVKVKAALKSFRIKLKEKDDSLAMERMKFVSTDESSKTTAHVQANEDAKNTTVRTPAFGSLWWLLLLVGMIAGIVITLKLKK